jgi:hypothetical protein
MIWDFWGSREHRGPGVLILGALHLPVSPLATGRARLAQRSGVWVGLGPVSWVAALETVSGRSAGGRA